MLSLVCYTPGRASTACLPRADARRHWPCCCRTILPSAVPFHPGSSCSQIQGAGCYVRSGFHSGTGRAALTPKHLCALSWRCSRSEGRSGKESSSFFTCSSDAWQLLQRGAKTVWTGAEQASLQLFTAVQVHSTPLVQGSPTHRHTLQSGNSRRRPPRQTQGALQCRSRRRLPWTGSPATACQSQRIATAKSARSE